MLALPHGAEETVLMTGFLARLLFPGKYGAKCCLTATGPIPGPPPP